MTKTKWFLSLMLTLAMVLTLIPAFTLTASAAENGTVLEIGIGANTTVTESDADTALGDGNIATITEIKIIGTATSLNWGDLAKTVYYNSPGWTSLTTLDLSEMTNLTSLTGDGGQTPFRLSTVSFPSSITTIGDHAFAGCGNLVLTTLPNGVTTIGEYAFLNCFNLALTTLPSGVTTIGYSAFLDCFSLALTALPSGVTTIGNNAFFGCESLALTALPSGLSTIGDNAFRDCKNLVLTALPSGVTTIGGEAFRDCIGIHELQLPASVTSIGSNAFSSWRAGSRIYVPNATVAALLVAGTNYTAANTTVVIDTPMGKLRAAAAAGGTYTLSQNIADSDKLTAQLDISEDFTLDLNGYNLEIVVSSGNGIKIASGKTFTITDSSNPSTGTLTVVNTKEFAQSGENAGINTTDGTLIINSGTVNATGGSYGAGIGGGYTAAGGGYRGDGGTITINGGTVNATGGNTSAGIGGGYDGDGGTITISGGTVNATGGTNSAGIGGGYDGDGGTITITGGTVNATGRGNGAGIGGSYRGNGGIITISGGFVNARSIDHYARDIGTGNGGSAGTTTITGGSVFAAGGSADGFGGTSLYPVKVTVKNTSNANVDGASVTHSRYTNPAVTGGNLTSTFDTATLDSGVAWLWLPEGEATITASISDGSKSGESKSANYTVITTGANAVTIALAYWKYDTAPVTPVGNTYTITTPQQLAWIAAECNDGNNFVGKTILLANNIDLDGKEWSPIGDGAHNFKGTFDGGGYTISNMTMEDSTAYYQGLLGYIESTATVKNVNVDGYIYGDSRVGGIVGVNNCGTVINCSFSGTVTSSVDSAGGIVGRNNAGTIKNCYNSGSIIGNNSVGGIVGANTNTGTIKNCYNSGSIIGNISVGGIAGHNMGTIQNCYNYGTVQGNNFCGCIAGNNGGTVENAYFATDTSGLIHIGIGDNAGTVTNVVGMTLAQMKTDIFRDTLNANKDDDAVMWQRDNSGVKNNGLPYFVPVEPTDIAAILGVTPPARGATPVTTITPTVQYTGTVAWSGTPTTFAANTIYTATITLTETENYTLKGVTEDFFTVAGGTATNDAGSGVVTVVFPKTAKAVIEIAAILGVTPPVRGATPVTAITPTAQYTGTVEWSGNPATFAANTVYTATITLMETENYTSAGVSENFFTVTGGTATNGADSGVITVVFPKTAANSSGGGGAGSGGITYYTVKFDTDGDNVVQNQSIARNGKATKPSDPTKDGYTFAGWYTDIELTKEYDFSTAATGNITIYAKWTKQEKPVDPDNPTPPVDSDNPTPPVDPDDPTPPVDPDDLTPPVDPNEWKNPFTDVKTSDWFYGDVKYVHMHGLFNGTSANTFSPNDATTRAMFCQILANLEGVDLSAYKTSRFTDVAAGVWYAAAVEWAAGRGIVAGTGNEKFGPDSSITREQMAVMLNNYIRYKKISLPSASTSTVFADEDKISSWAFDSVKVIQSAGIISGKPGNLYDPKVDASRAEVAAIFARFIKIITP